MSTTLRLPFTLASSTLFALVVVAAQPSPPSVQTPSTVVQITLRPAVSVNRAQALLEDVAVLEGGEVSQRQRLGKLDLIDLPSSGAEVIVSREQVMYRLLLGGIDRELFQIKGAAIVRISQSPRMLAGPVVNVAHRELVVGEVSEANAVAASPILIKNRDNVQLVLNVGELQVTARGEALQDGRAGERISVRNVDSSRVVHGRVLNRTVVEIDFDRSKP